MPHRPLAPNVQAPLPSAANAQVWIDFDGTITQKDVLDELIARFSADDSWQTILEQWKKGSIGSEECLRRSFDLIRVDKRELDELLASIPVDVGFARLVELLRHRRVPVAILSDGIDWFIQRIVGAELLEGLAIRANTLKLLYRRVQFICPHGNPSCTSAAAHCKCASVDLLRQAGRQSIYIGDGRSDLCPARKADFIFAKGDLAEVLTTEGIPFASFQTLQDVAARLEKAWGKPLF